MSTRQTLHKPLLPVKSSPAVPMEKGNWIQLESILYQDNEGNKKTWERCVRRKTRPSDIDAIDIHAILLTPEPEILLIVQYRPAIERYCIEFPSGLIDADENDPINSAQRELKEETGYSIPKNQFSLVKVPVAYEPGLSNSCCFIAKVTIDTTTLKEPVVQELEPDEWTLQTVSLPLNQLMDRLIELEQSQEGLLVIDSRVHALASGLAYANEYNI